MTRSFEELNHAPFETLTLEERDRWAYLFHHRPPACHAWSVTSAALTEATYVRGIEEFELRMSRGERLLRVWQDNRCAMCGGRFLGDRVSDHDHATALVRGYLCRSCNIQEGANYYEGQTPAQYRALHPTRQLGIQIVYYHAWYGYARPERHPGYLPEARRPDGPLDYIDLIMTGRA